MPERIAKRGMRSPVTAGPEFDLRRHVQATSEVIVTLEAFHRLSAAAVISVQNGNEEAAAKLDIYAYRAVGFGSAPIQVISSKARIG